MQSHIGGNVNRQAEPTIILNVRGTTVIGSNDHENQGLKIDELALQCSSKLAIYLYDSELLGSRGKRSFALSRSRRGDRSFECGEEGLAKTCRYILNIVLDAGNLTGQQREQGVNQLVVPNPKLEVFHD